MAAPSNIRINPFIGDGGTTNYVDFTEVHIIPAVSPFVVRLNEVPQKKDPSNMKVVYMNEATGAPTTTALTEVAATPGAGEFRPDYSTNAASDEDWNTGLIEFSSADAGKSIQVSYTGMGTLAGVKNNRFPSWWLNRGDGSDGDFAPENNTTISGIKKYRRVFIKSGVTVTVDRYARIHCLGAVIVNGNINAVGMGSVGGIGGSGSSIGDKKMDGTNGQDGNSSVGGYGVGGYGGGGQGAAGGTIERTDVMIDSYFCIARGSGGGGGGGRGGNGGNGGNGGGDIIIIASSVKVGGLVSVDGMKGFDATGKGGGGGGGGGGRVCIVAYSVIGADRITAAGGAGGSGNGGGAQGGNGIRNIVELGAI